MTTWLPFALFDKWLHLQEHHTVTEIRSAPCVRRDLNFSNVVRPSALTTVVTTINYHVEPIDMTIFTMSDDSFRKLKMHKIIT